MSLLPIQIPDGFVLTINKGDFVRSGQVIGKRNERFAQKRIPLAKLLNTPAKKVAKYLRKNPGDSIKDGEIIAVKPSFISVMEVVSKASGTMLRFERDSGDIVFEIQSKEGLGEQDIVSPFDGTIVTCSESVIELDAKNGGLLGIKGVGGDAKGVLFVADKDPKSVVEGLRITVDMIGNVVLGGIFSREALVKASGMGVSGIVTGKMNDEDTLLLEQKRMLLPLLEVDLETWQRLAKQEGKQVYLDSIAKTILVS